MPKLDAAMSKKIMSDVARMPEDGKPLWGKMTPAQIRGHLRGVVEYTMGTGREMPFKGNAVTRHVFRHLIINGIVKIPKGIKLPRQADGTPVPIPECGAAELEATLNDFVNRCNNGGFEPRMHPFFGKLTCAEWQKFHVAHFKHHLSQYGVWS